MASKRSGVVVGIVAVAVIGVVAITFYAQRGRVADEDAAGAIGAAERYRAEQITDSDVILDIPGQEELAAAVFEVLTDEQKAELIGRIDEAGRQALYARFNEADAFARMSPEQQGRYIQSLDRAAQERIANALRFEAADLGRMNADALGRAVANMDAEAREEAFGRFNADEAFERMSAERQGHFVQALDRAAQERVAAALRFDAADLGRMNAEALGRAVAAMDAEARAETFGRFKAEEAFERMSAERQGHFVQALDRAAQERFAEALRIDAADVGRMDAEALGKAVAAMDAEARAEAVGKFHADEAFERMSAERRGHLTQALDRAAQERVANALRFDAADLGRLNAEALGRAVANMDAEARAEAFGKFNADEAFERMSAERRGHLTQALDRAAQERVANALRFDAADLGRLNAEALGRAVARLDAEAREQAIGRFEGEDAFQRMDDFQRAAFADALGARAFERAILQARAFNNLRQEQQLAVWAELGRNGQEAALRYTGLSADLARGNALERQMQLDRFMNERQASQEARTR